MKYNNARNIEAQQHDRKIVFFASQCGMVHDDDCVTISHNQWKGSC